MKEKIDALVILKSLEAEAKKPLKKISDLTIKSQADFDLAGELLKELKTLAKQADQKEKSFTSPLLAVVTDIRDFFRPFKELIKQIEADTKPKMLNFIQQQKSRQEKLKDKFEAGELSISTYVGKSNALEVTNGAAQARKVWTAIPVNPELTPREFLVPDETAIKEAFKSGRKVKGWKWEQVESIAI